MSLDIKIDEDYKITSDERNIMLQRKGIVQESKMTNPGNVGNEYWVTEGFYRTIQQALTEYKRLIVLNSNCQSFDELFKLLEDIKSLIERLPDIN